MMSEWCLFKPFRNVKYVCDTLVVYIVTDYIPNMFQKYTIKVLNYTTKCIEML